MPRPEPLPYPVTKIVRPEPRPLTDVGRAALALIEAGRKPTVPEVAPLAKAFRELPGNLAGGVLHTFLDDGNIDDKSVAWCAEYAREIQDEDAVALAQVLLRMSKTQRRKIV
jgi:hypothetical protein